MIVREAKCGQNNRFLTLILPLLRLLVDLPTCSFAACWHFVCAESVPTLCVCRECAENTVFLAHSLLLVKQMVQTRSCTHYVIYGEVITNRNVQNLQVKLLIANEAHVLALYRLGMTAIGSQ